MCIQGTKMQRVLGGCSSETPLDSRTFSTHIVKKLRKNYYVDCIYLHYM